MHYVLSSQYEQCESNIDRTTEIDIWIWPLIGSSLNLNKMETLLSADETTRARRFVKPIDSARFIIARGTLRKILALYCQINPQSISFNYNKYGKPTLGFCHFRPVHFNLSHSGNYAVLAVSNQCEIGVDIEEIKPFHEDIATRFFSTNECAVLANIKNEDYLEAFYRCWTRKEAFVKAHGTGLTLPLNSFDVTVHKFLAPKITRLEGLVEPWHEWNLMNINVPDTYTGAVVAHTMAHNTCLVYRDFQAL
ncbi:4'-phosphopantetheinyl transferase superfamily protein [Ahrensia sp. 13_GOM-1096m]|uniref:4'-phosphopantetheinyl transferase family protein n=1 Tax=Ahrensia sp. 13_GOM-1096m TaxID=1380380 RepID=UPI000687A91F|nr:4'-phosphopantetheinyl transferase superfamily protein [Ahrensia sp. 13_GOM-1096m]